MTTRKKIIRHNLGLAHREGKRATHLLLSKYFSGYFEPYDFVDVQDNQIAFWGLKIGSMPIDTRYDQIREGIEAITGKRIDSVYRTTASGCNFFSYPTESNEELWGHNTIIIHLANFSYELGAIFVFPETKVVALENLYFLTEDRVVE